MTSKLLSTVVMLVTVASLLQGRAAGIPSPTYGAPIPILQDERSQDGHGGYAFQYSTGNGIKRKEQGRQMYGQNSEGGWSYTSPEGAPVEITFVADQGGYQPVGAVIPIPPELPYARTQQF